MNDIIITINKKTREKVGKEIIKIGLDGENLQDKIIFEFEDEFVDGEARAEIEFEDETKNYITLTKHENTYELPVKSSITKKGVNYIQLVIDEGVNDEVPIFKSKKIPILVEESINAVEEAPDGYEQWLDLANAKINQMNTLINDLTQKVESGYFDGKDATINGYNILNIIAGEHVIIEQDGNTLIISAEGVAPLPNNHLETSDGDIFMTSDDAYFIVKESD